MRVLVQRVHHASVTVAGRMVGRIDRGMLLFAGFGTGDTETEVGWMAQRIAGLRIFEDEAGKMNRSVDEAGGRILAVPQFTLYGDCRKGRRPDFSAAAQPDKAAGLFDRFCTALRGQGVQVETGAFREHMQVELENNGPVTLWVEREAASGVQASEPSSHEVSS